MSTMQVEGILIKVQRYSFKDKDSGDTVEGGKVVLGVTPDDKQKNDVTGYALQEIKMDYDSYQSISALAKSKDLFCQNVFVDCSVILRGTGIALKAVGLSDKAF